MIGAILAFALKIDLPGIVAIVLSFAMTRRRPVGYTTACESQVDPVSGSRIDRTDVDPR